MAFRRRARFGGFRPRRFSGRPVARKEPIWITTAFNEAVDTQLQQSLFQLVGPEDYTPDYLSEESRKDKCTLVRTVGHFLIIPALGNQADSVISASYKAALFVAGDKEIDDAFAADPLQFNIETPSVFVEFCRNFPPLKVFWTQVARDSNQSLAVVATRYPPAVLLEQEWDVTVKRKMEGDGALFLLINHALIPSDPEQEIGGIIDVEARNLIMDQ